MMTLEEFQLWFNQRFFILLEEKGTAFISYSNNPSIKNILSHLYTLAEGGKRLRPYLAYVGYVTEGGEHDMFTLLAAIELLHLFCLIHDDIIDNAAIRHDVSTMHMQFDTSIALLTGDMVLAWSFECLHAVEEIEPYTADDCMREFEELLSEVIHGQMLDTAFKNDQSVTKEMIEEKMQLKTAHYSFYRPLAVGMLAAGADSDAMDFAQSYAVPLGMAFQLRDDLRDMAEDFSAGQNSLLTWYVNQKDLSEKDARRLASEDIDRYLAKSEDAILDHDKHDEEVWQEVIAIVRK